MQIDVIASINEAHSDDFVHKTVIVIDVLRATSSIVTALGNGCAGVVPVETVSQAKNLQKSGDLLAGERFCKKIISFDFGNSPLEYMSPEIKGKKIILTTTNGTRAIYKSMKAAHVLAGSMLNARSSAQAAISLKRDIVIVCAGTQDQFSLEDGLCAGLIIDELNQLLLTEASLNDFAAAMHRAYLQAKESLQEAVLSCANGTKMCRLGLKEDIIFCTRVNVYTTVPMLYEHTMRPFVF